MPSFCHRIRALVNDVYMRYALRMGSYSNHDESAWSSRDFDDVAAAEWVRYGFYDPAVAQEWASVVDDPAEAVYFQSRGVDPASASGWMDLAQRRGHGFRMDEAFDAVDGNYSRARSYDMHFQPEDWAYLYEAGVRERAVASVARLVDAIETRNIDFSAQPDRETVIYDALRWLGSSADYSLTRVNLLQNLILRNVEMKDVQFVLCNQDLGVSADDAIRANNWAEEAKFEYDGEGNSAYRLLATTPDAGSKAFASLLKQYGIRNVVSAMDTGLEGVAQLEYYLQHGGVVEISRGAL